MKGHRRIRQMVEEINEIHEPLLNKMLENSEQKLEKYLDLKGVYVIIELLTHGNENIKQKIKQVLKNSDKIKELSQNNEQMKGVLKLKSMLENIN